MASQEQMSAAWDTSVELANRIIARLREHIPADARADFDSAVDHCDLNLIIADMVQSTVLSKQEL